MPIPQEIIDQVLSRADILDVAKAFHLELKRSGANDFKACCPFHQERTPSFHLNTTRQFYHCFGCGVGGDAVNLVKGLARTDFPGAIRWLGNFYHIPIPEGDDTRDPQERQKSQRRDQGWKLLEEVAGFFQSSLNAPEGKAAREYLQGRGLDEETIRKYRLGYAPNAWDAVCRWALSRGFSQELLMETGIARQSEKSPGNLHDLWKNRVMFPICDELSRVVGFSGRLFTPQEGAKAGKYVNSPDNAFFHKSQILYGFNLARDAFGKAKRAVVCEGQLDVIACHRAGVGEALAAQGTAFTKEHANRLAKARLNRVDLAFDGDAAGLKAIWHTLPLLLARGMNVHLIFLPPGEDPDSLYRRGGPESLRKIMADAHPALPYLLSRLCQETPPDTPEAKASIAQQMLGLYSTISDPLVANGYCQELIQRLSLPSPQAVFDRLAQLRLQEKEAQERGQAPSPPPEALPRQDATAQALFHDLHGVASLAETMLDLCVSYPQVAELWKDLDLGEVMSPQNPVVRALNSLLAGTAEGDWEGAREALFHGELASDTNVSRILGFSAFVQENLTDEILQDKLAKAVEDCQRRLELLELERQLQAINQELQQNPAPDASLPLLRKSQELARKKALLRKGRQP